MKISHRLIALSTVSAGGLLCAAVVSYVAVTSIQSDLHGLTLRAAPLQARTLELQERTERLMGSLLRLSLARTPDDVAKAGGTIAAEMKAMDRLRVDIRTLDPKATQDNAEFRAAHEQIARAVDKRLADEQSYRAETESARAALTGVEGSVSATRAAVAQIGVEAGKSADKAQEAIRRLTQTTRQSLEAQTRLKEVALVVSEIDAVGNRFRLTPLKEKVKAPLDSLQRLEPQAGGDDHLKDVRTAATKLWDSITRDNDGLMALRAKVLAKADGAEAAYAAQRKAVLAPVDELGAKLGTLIDGLEVQAVKQRQTLEAALKLRNEPGGVVSTSEEVSLAIRDMVGTLRLLMLATSTGDADAAHRQLATQAEQMKQQLAGMRAGLQKMNRSGLVQQVEAALGSMAAVARSIDSVGQTKRGLLASEEAMAQSLAQLKAVAARQTALGEQQAKSVGQRQAEVSAAVDRRVQSSIALIVGIAAVIIAVIGVLSWHTVRTVTRRLDAAVSVAEHVSQGVLLDVPAARGRDEMARLMTALSTMVGTLRGIVGDIRVAAEQIDTGSSEINRGNLDLSQRTEEQASQLQQTAASVEQLATTIRGNADSAREANALAVQASEIAAHGGAVVGQVVSTMEGIQDASRRIAEIIGVIDGIAFQTNILALNAAVEAARAGEHGRGFAVVASEVRALAGKSAEAAHQIKDIVNASVERVDSGAQLVRSAGSTMDGIVQQVGRVNTLIAEIARASGEQADSVSALSATVVQLDAMTQRNASLAEQGTAAASSLRSQAEGLTQAVSVFRAEAAAPAA